MQLRPFTLPGPDFELHFQRLMVECPDLQQEGARMLQLVQALQELEGPDLLANTCSPAGLILSADARGRVRVAVVAHPDHHQWCYRVEYSLRPPWTWAGTLAPDTAGAVQLILEALARAEPPNPLLERLAAAPTPIEAPPPRRPSDPRSDDFPSPLERLWQERGLSWRRRHGTLEDGTPVLALLSPRDPKRISTGNCTVTVMGWLSREASLFPAFGVVRLTETSGTEDGEGIWTHTAEVLAQLWSVQFDGVTAGLDLAVRAEISRLLAAARHHADTDLRGYRTFELEAPGGPPEAPPLTVRVREDRSKRAHTFRWRVTAGPSGATGGEPTPLLTLDVHGCEDLASIVTSAVVLGRRLRIGGPRQPRSGQIRK